MFFYQLKGSTFLLFFTFLLIFCTYWRKRLKHNIVNHIVFLGEKLFQQLNTTDDDVIHRAQDEPWTTEVAKFYIIQVTKPVKALGPEEAQCNSGKQVEQ